MRKYFENRSGLHTEDFVLSVQKQQLTFHKWDFAVLAYFRGLSSFKFRSESRDLTGPTRRAPLCILIVSEDNNFFFIHGKAITPDKKEKDFHLQTWLQLKVC